MSWDRMGGAKLETGPSIQGQERDGERWASVVAVSKFQLECGMFEQAHGEESQ